MDTRLTQALRSFRDRYPGQEGEHKRLHGWLLDHAPQEKRAATALVAVPRLELHVQIVARPGKVDGFQFRRWVDTLVADALPADLAEQALLAWLEVLGVEAPDASALVGPVDAGQVTVSLDAARALHLATVLADLRPIAQITVENLGQRPLRELLVKVRLGGNEVGSRLSSTTWTGRVDRLAGKQAALLDGVDPQVGRNALHEVQAPTNGRWWIEVEADGQLLLRTWRDVEVLPPRAWLLGRAPTPALAAFVVPDDVVVAELVNEAAQRVDVDDPRAGALKATEALERLLGELELAEAPATPDERVLGPRAVITHGRATRLERQLLLAACLEQAGLTPLLLWTADGPALGLWVTDDRPALTETDDPELVRRLVAAGALVVRPVGDHVASLESEPFLALDLASARRLGVRPLPAEVLSDGQPAPADESPGGQLRQRLLDRALLSGGRSTVGARGAWAALLGRRFDAADSAPPRVQGWKRKLLDLSLRNPLLSLRARANTLPLLVHDLAALEDALSSGQHFDLQPRPPAPRPGLPLPDVDAAMMEGSFRAGALLVDLPEKRVATASKNALRDLRGALDEGGVHTLFLCVGLLRWSADPTEDTPRQAPLLLIPVVMRRTKGGVHQLKKADGDPEFNPALLEFLRREHGVEIPSVSPLPADTAGVDVPAILAAIRKELAKAKTTAGWTVAEEAWVAVISFSGFRMWRDLDQRASDLLRHPLVRRLALGESSGDAPELPRADRLDDDWSPEDVFCPLEADGSQLAAVRAATTGHSFVLEGPPGTGKSQTIANLIAHAIAAGQSVLFVSQKRAALEVVHERLAKVGLGPFTLELHSRKASKQAFVQQLKEAAEVQIRKPTRDWLQDAQALGKARAELNATARALHAVRPPGLSVFRAVAELEDRRGTPVVPCDFDPTRSVEADWLDGCTQALLELGPALAAVGPEWEGLDPIGATDWPRPKREALAATLDELREAARAVKEALGGLTPWLPDLPGASADQLDLAVVVLDKVAGSPRPRAALLDPAVSLDELETWLTDVETARKHAEALGTRWRPVLLERPLDPLEDRLKQWIGVFLLGWLMLLGLRWSLKTAVAPGKGVPPNQRLLQDLRVGQELVAARAAVQAGLGPATAAFGPLDRDAWGLPVVEPRHRELVAWVRDLRRRAKQLEAAIPLAADDAPPEAAAAITTFRAAWDRFTGLRRQVQDELQLGGGWGRTTEAGYIDAIERRVDELATLVPRLRPWGGYRKIRDQAHALGLQQPVKALERGEISAEELPAAFRHAWLRWWVARRVTEDPALAGFDGVRQRAREERFGSMDAGLRDLVRQEVTSRLVARQPRLDQGAPPNSQAGILLRQFQQKARFASPRTLFTQCAGLIRQLKPCVLMSPQSVAQYLDPAQPPFDLVVFDEASQVPIHEAIGAIARGRNVVVVGDSRQLPPTTFFLGQESEDDEAEDELVAELESILEECAASGLPSLRLTWHYRSRHPTLIAFSNARYYGNGLQVLPTARAHEARLGVSRVLVKGAVYDRGGSATNVLEAEALVADIVRRLRDPVERARSLGVVTFSRAQQALVEDLLDAAREQHPEIDPLFDAETHPEPVFVKNLENVQGDERDVVLFSVGYGPDATGKVRANMGPLGQRGGERRLNVAITRAREQLVLYVSFEPDQLDLSGTAARGLHDLKAFLESAAKGGDVLVGSDHLEHDPVETAVQRALARRLEEAGHQADLDVGVGGYRLDLAIRDPDDPDAWLVGVELDGPTYAGTATARDRDRLRWEVLAGLGWRHLHRVRILEWYEDPDAVVAAITDRVEVARAEAAAERAETELDAESPEPEPDADPEAAEEDPEVGDAEAGPGQDFVRRGDSSFETRTYTVTQVAPGTVTFQVRHPQVLERLLQVVETEGPVSERLAARRIADAFGLARSSTALIRAAPGIFARVPATRRPRIHEGFYWPTGLDPATWRVWRAPDAAVPESKRAIEDIALEELGNAARDLRARYGDMPEEDLARAVAQAFGFRGLTTRISERVAEAIRRIGA